MNRNRRHSTYNVGEVVVKRNVIVTTMWSGLICFTLALGADQPGGNYDRDTLREIEPVMRDPFWPVGYYPKTEAEQEQATTEQVAEQEEIYHEEAATQLQFSRVNRMGTRYFAMINGSPYEIGDYVSLNYKGRMYQWKIISISDRGVRLQPVMEDGKDSEEMMEIETSHGRE